MIEDGVLNRVTVAQLLATLADEPRMVLELTFGLTYPEKWPWPNSKWPPTYADVGFYVGVKFRGKPLSEAAIRYIRNAALRQLHAVLMGSPISPSKPNRVRTRYVST
jgi:hypothetical protein